jgi:hypothetical protein
MHKKIFALVIIAAFLVGTVVTISDGVINVQAQTMPTMRTYAISDAIPNLLGVGQETLLKCGITQALESAEYGWSNITITVVAPNGDTETLGPFKTDSTGSTYTLYTPDQVGTYNLTTNFPQQPMPVNTFDLERGAFIPAGTIMLASTAKSQMIVTEEAAPSYPGHALPTEYWSRPIDPQLREWYSISGNWVTRDDNSIAPYNEDAPETAHTLWAMDLTTGGLTGGLWGDGQIPASSESGDAYEGKFSNSVIMNGILYYNLGTAGFAGTTDVNGIRAVDIHTGKELWFKNGTSLAFGQILYWNSYNVDGVYTYIYSTSGSTWTAYDPFTGEWQFTFENVPSGAATVRGPSGEILIYQIDYVNNRLMLWNSTLAGLQTAARGTADMGSWASNNHMKTLDASNPLCYSWNVSIPAGLTASTSFFSPILKVYNDDRVVSIFFNQTDVRVWALNIHGLTSTSTSTTKLFDKWWDAPAEWLAGSNTLHYVGASNYVTDSVYGNGVIGVWDKELTTHYGFSVVDGSYLWATQSESYLDAYGWGNAEHTWYYAYGKLYSVGVGGILYAYDLSSGSTAWTYNMTDVYGEPVTGQNWWGWITLIADNKIYLGTLEHSAEQPLPRGAPQICVNASNGAEIWRVNGMYRNTRWGGNGIMGDSIITTMDTYDQRIYAIGKGPSAVTIDVPGVGLTFGQSVMIRGSVTDVSPGTTTDSMQMRFPNGVPAVSDGSQSQWMLYVYKQFERPINATGVPLTISVIDANGNYRTIGTTTSDSNGQYNFAWIPDISGTFTVYVTFEGSAAYYASTAGSAFVVDQPVAIATPQPTATPSMSDVYFLPAIAGLFVAIIVVGLLTILMVRKRP